MASVTTSAAQTEPGDDAPRPRRSYSNGRRKRAELVDAAFDVFATQGFQQLSIRQIAEAIGTSHTALLHHFGSKDALLEAVLEERERRDGPWRQQVLDEKGFLDGVPEIMAHNANYRGVILLDNMLQAEAISPDHPAHEFIVRRDRDFLTAVLGEVTRLQASGEIRAELDPLTTARQVVALIEGVETAWLYDPTVDMAACLRGFMQLVRA